MVKKKMVGLHQGSNMQHFIENKAQTETGYFVSSGLKRLKGSELCCVTLQRRKHSETEMLDFR